MESSPIVFGAKYLSRRVSTSAWRSSIVPIEYPHREGEIAAAVVDLETAMLPPSTVRKSSFDDDVDASACRADFRVAREKLEDLRRERGQFTSRRVSAAVYVDAAVRVL